MDVHVPTLVEFGGGPTTDGDGVAVMGKTDDNKPVMFCLERDKVSWVIASLAQWTQKAAKKAKWKAQRIVGQDDTGIWMRPTQFGLVDTDIPNTVNLVFDVGPVRFRFALKRSRALELGRALAAASAAQYRPS